MEITIPTSIFFEKNLLDIEEERYEEIPEHLLEHKDIINYIYSIYASPKARVTLWYLWAQYKEKLINHYLSELQALRFNSVDINTLIEYFNFYLFYNLVSPIELEARLKFLSEIRDAGTNEEDIKIINKGKKYRILYPYEEISILASVLADDLTAIYNLIPIEIMKAIIIDKTFLMLPHYLNNPPKGAQNQFFSAIYTTLIGYELEKNSYVQIVSGNEIEFQKERDAVDDE
jgi:hypothetical protein